MENFSGADCSKLVGLMWGNWIHFFAFSHFLISNSYETEIAKSMKPTK